MAFDSKKFLVRTGSAAVFVVVLLGCIFWNYLSFSILFLVVSLWGLHEFYKLMSLKEVAAQKWIGYVIAFLTFSPVILLNLGNTLFQPVENSEDLFNSFNENNFEDHLRYLQIVNTIIRYEIMLAVTLLFLCPIAELFRKKEKPLENIAVTMFGLFYCVLPFILLHFISFINAPFGGRYQSSMIFALFLLIWSNDTFAYLVGSFIGRHKMIERISPGKTWEGTVGGGLLTIAASFLIWKWFGLLELHDWIIISAIVAVFGTLGDLVESMLKRSVGVKDSGKIMPGHGGILDRFDSLIMVAPFVFLYLLFK